MISPQTILVLNHTPNLAVLPTTSTSFPRATHDGHPVSCKGRCSCVSIGQLFTIKMSHQSPTCQSTVCLSLAASCTKYRTLIRKGRRCVCALYRITKRRGVEHCKLNNILSNSSNYRRGGVVGFNVGTLCLAVPCALRGDGLALMHLHACVETVLFTVILFIEHQRIL